jgi:hypothetical protein
MFEMQCDWKSQQFSNEGSLNKYKKNLQNQPGPKNAKQPTKLVCLAVITIYVGDSKLDFFFSCRNSSIK